MLSSFWRVTIPQKTKKQRENVSISVLLLLISGNENVVIPISTQAQIIIKSLKDFFLFCLHRLQRRNSNRDKYRTIY